MAAHPPVVVVLDNLRSVHNTASIARSAWFFGVEALHACGTTPLPQDRFGRWRSDFAKVALGAERVLPIHSWESTLQALEALRTQGMFVACLEQHPQALPLEHGVRKARFPVALVVGEERHGIDPSVLSVADSIWEIRRVGGKESLNVAVAAGIALWALRTFTL